MTVAAQNASRTRVAHSLIFSVADGRMSTDAVRAYMGEIAIPALMGGMLALPAPFVPVEGSRVRCAAGSIDSDTGEGVEGTVRAFARLSAYHSREAFVTLDNGESGWFWVRNLLPAVTVS